MLELLKNNTKRITHIPHETRHRIRQLAYFRMIHGSDLVCHQSTRMDRRCFAILCHLLRTIARLTSTEVVDVEEMVAMFLHILKHDVKNRVIQQEFMRSVNVPTSDRARYRTRKGEVTTNVLSVCDMKGDFVYILAGWEGSVADSRILRYALSGPNGLKAITTWLMPGTQMQRVSWHHKEANATTCKNGVALKMHLQRRKSSSI
ncbi:retrotransposon protein [Cucumis melo var. makuwa]|uniref:Putative nuclease HARBI1 n=1 Tax=Cucumis melo var. makuwa TaxID=1194695 RepID=A0A5D3CHE2_CUCMM|nr:retrotransposon protein [Cucumis melo var. makuwa]